MTIEFLSLVGRYQGDGVQTEFPTGFPLFGDERYVKAVISTGGGSALKERPLVYGVDYTVREVAGGGECVTAAPVPAGGVLTLYLELPCRQPRDFDNAGRLDAEEIEKGLDYVTALAAQTLAAGARAIKVPISSEQTPEQLLADIFDARDEAVTCRDEACACAAHAEISADKAQRSAELALAARNVSLEQADATNKLMAAELAKINVIADALRDDVRDTTQAARDVTQALRDDVREMVDKAGTVQTVNGIGPDENKNVQLTRIVTQAEYDALKEAGELVPGATYVISDALRWGGGGGIPLLIPIAVPFSTVMPGFLSVTRDNGILTADAFPEACRQLVNLQEAGETNIVDMDDWQNEFVANSGKCGRFALDAEARTFRLPCMPGVYWRGVMTGLAVGQYQNDEIRSHRHGIALYNYNVGGSAPGHGLWPAADSVSFSTYTGGSETRPISIVCDYQMRMQ